MSHPNTIQVTESFKNLSSELSSFMTEGVIVLDSSDCIGAANEAALKLFGMENHEFLGKHLSGLYNDRDEDHNFLDFLSEYKNLRNWQNTFVRADGQNFIGRYSAMVISDWKNQFNSKLILIQDITEKVQADADAARWMSCAKKMGKELDQFMYIITHDLKAPLRAIGNLTSWIEEDVTTLLKDESLKNFALLKARVKRMESMIIGLSEYSKLGKRSSESKLMDVSQLLADVLCQLNVPSHIKIEVDGELPNVFAHQGNLSRIFYNLIDNAIKYNDKEVGLIKISSQKKENCVEFTVEDNGPGISPDHHEKIFMIFQTLQSKDQVESTGMGLTIVKKIIETYGGKIQVKSEGTCGTKFIFTWPN